ncbi:hypothetical protein BU17DRAFT_63818 [Hysterangium stoloniferum]|nr:hypothetical protein BU17DRAFT_63818 [Hysterangium stoloniferum]
MCVMRKKNAQNISVPQNAPSVPFWGGAQRWHASSLSLMTSVSMAWEDVAEGSAAMTGWRCGREVVPGLETGAGYYCLCGLSTEQQFAYSTCKFARDGPSYAIRITEMDMDLYFCEEWYMTVSSPFSVLTSPSTAPPGACSSYHSTVQSGSRSGSRFATLDSVLILNDVRVTDEVVNSSRALLASSRALLASSRALLASSQSFISFRRVLFPPYECIADQFQ